VERALRDGRPGSKDQRLRRGTDVNRLLFLLVLYHILESAPSIRADDWWRIDSLFSDSSLVLLDDASVTSVAVLTSLGYEVFHLSLIDSAISRELLRAEMVDEAKVKFHFETCYKIADSRRDCTTLASVECIPYPKEMSVVKRHGTAALAIGFWLGPHARLALEDVPDIQRVVHICAVKCEGDGKDLVRAIETEFDRLALDFSFEVPTVLKRE
jgi:hypothetical protein